MDEHTAKPTPTLKAWASACTTCKDAYSEHADARTALSAPQLAWLLRSQTPDGALSQIAIWHADWGSACPQRVVACMHHADGHTYVKAPQWLSERFTLRSRCMEGGRAYTIWAGV